MIWKIYGRAWKVIATKPLKLWGISMLAVLLDGLALAGFGAIPGVYVGISLLLTTGATMVYLHGYRGDQIEAIQLFDSFRGKDTAKRVLIGMAWKSLIVFLWGLIPVVGFVFAIIRNYEYRLTPYILVTEPDVEPLEAYKVSRERTRGYVGKMFAADLLVYAAVYTVVLFLALFMLIPVHFIQGFFGFIMVVFLIVAAAVLPLFTGLVQAAFYEEITNPTIDVESGRETVKCPACGARVEKGAAFCASCGAPMPKEEPAEQVTEETPAKKFCSKCGAEVAADAAFCPVCGNKL